jgi:excisionase family DNA binding protein
MPQTKPIAEPISTAEAAVRNQVTANYITLLARKGVIAAKKLGRDWMIDESSLSTYLATPHKRGPKLGSHHKRMSASPPPLGEGK